MVKISVIIPVYNMEKYLEECLKSVFSQTLREIEVIAINDGSTDLSLNILKEWEQKDARLIIIDKKNEGAGAARNDGIKVAKGEFIAFLDADDKFFSDQTLEHCYIAAVENNVLIAGGYYRKLLPEGKWIDEQVKTVGDIDISAVGLTDYKDFQFDYSYTCYIYNRDLLINNQILFPLYKRFQDPPFFVRAMITAGSFYALDEPTYTYRFVPSMEKYNVERTVDFFKGVIDILLISQEYNLSKLHYISAFRLNNEGSYMAIKNIYGNNNQNLLYYMIKANSLVDTEWLEEEGYHLQEPFVMQAFNDIVFNAHQYEKIRTNKVLRAITFIPKRIMKKTVKKD